MTLGREPYLEPYLRSWVRMDDLLRPYLAGYNPFVRAPGMAAREVKRERVAGVVRMTFSDGTAWWYVIRDGIGRYEQDTSRGWDALG